MARAETAIAVSLAGSHLSPHARVVAYYDGTVWDYHVEDCSPADDVQDSLRHGLHREITLWHCGASELLDEDIVPILDALGGREHVEGLLGRISDGFTERRDG